MKFSIPPAALEQHMAFVGKTGSGKTSTTKLVVEQIVPAGARVCVLDPIKSDWWGITSSADGKRAGLPFQILGGPRGHVALPSSAGKAVAELVANGALPLSIIDMADFEPGGLQKFFNDFAPTLLKKMRGVVYLVVEEAHEFAPKERGGIGAETLAIHWAKKLATAGRSKGIRLLVATQRTQSLHNAVLGSCDTLIAHRLTAPADQKPILDWLKANTSKTVLDDVAGSLASLKTGTAWLCSGEARVFEKMAFPRIKTYDNSATPTGDDGDHHVKMAPVDQDKLRAIIGNAVDEAEANDPKKLKAKIAELQSLISREGGGAATVVDLREAREAGRQEAWDAAKRTCHAEGYREALRNVHAAVAAMHAPDATLAPMPPKRAVVALPEPERKLQAEKAWIAKSTMADDLPLGEQACMIAIAQHSHGVTRQQLTVLTGYKRSTRDAYIQRLRAREFVEVRGDRVVATDAGIAGLGSSYDPLPTGAALRERVLRDLPEGERKVLEVLITHYPSSVERDRIDEITGFKRSTRDAYLQRLRSRELVDCRSGEVKARDDLFDEAA